MLGILVRGACAKMLNDSKSDSLEGAGFLSELSVKLFQNDYTPSRETVLADLTEADFDGYQAATAIELGEVHVDQISGKARVVGALAQFHASGDTTPNTIYGWYILGAGGELVAVGRFDSPIPVTSADDAVIFVPEIQLDSSWQQVQL